MVPACNVHCFGELSRCRFMPSRTIERLQPRAHVGEKLAVDALIGVPRQLEWTPAGFSFPPIHFSNVLHDRELLPRSSQVCLQAYNEANLHDWSWSSTMMHTVLQDSQKMPGICSQPSSWVCLYLAKIVSGAPSWVNFNFLRPSTYSA
jgi:hypothetical protein